MKFQFSIREMLLVTAIAGLAIGWWLDHRLQLKWRQGAEMQTKVALRMADKEAHNLAVVLEKHPEIPRSFDGAFIPKGLGSER